jgi:hypothetical protein
MLAFILMALSPPSAMFFGRFEGRYSASRNSDKFNIFLNSSW